MNDQPQRRWPPVLWAAVAPPLWAVLTLLPVGVVGALAGQEQPALWPVLLGLPLATVFVLRLDGRIGPELPPAPLASPVGWWIGAALLAGVGAMILASEVGNILLSLRSVAPPPPTAVLDPWIKAGISALQPVCLVVILQGVVQRSLSTRFPPTWALVGAVAIGTFVGLGPGWLQIAASLALPAWLFRHTGSLLPSMAAIAPHGIVPVLEALGISPGIPGFDLTAPDEVLWQPVWFDLLGAALLAAGVAPLLGVFGVGEEP